MALAPPYPSNLTLSPPKANSFIFLYFETFDELKNQFKNNETK